MTDPVKFYIDERKHGKFYITENEQQLGEMVFGISGQDMTVFHTEVNKEASGQGLARLMFDAMVAYARQHQLRVIPRCAYVHAQFKRHPEQYADIWKHIEAH